MREEQPVTRRTVLRLLGGGTLAALLGAGPGATADAEDAGGAIAEVLARIGRRYLELVPAERDLDTLRARLGEFTTTGDVLAGAAALGRAVERDFERGEILAVDGWILSRTELRAAALFALATP
jgi:hypothetical protein